MYISRHTLLTYNPPSFVQEEREERMKEEKMKIGIEKMKLAHKKKVAIKVGLLSWK